MDMISYSHVKLMHPGAAKLATVLRKHFFVHNLDKKIHDFTAVCITCISVKPRPKNIISRPKIYDGESKPFQRTFADIIDYGSRDKNGFRYALTYMDSLSYYMVAIPLKINRVRR